MFRSKPASFCMRPHITPDPRQAAELERRMSALDYYPQNGFHRDRRQHRGDPTPSIHQSIHPAGVRSGLAGTPRSTS